MTNVNEIWLPINGYEDYYEVSSLGRVRSLNRMVRHKHGGTRLAPEKYLSICTHKQGHHVVRLWKDNKTKLFNLYRLLAIHFIPNPEKKREVNHIDGDRTNYSLSNLEWCTPSENMKHAFRNNLCNGYYTKGFEHQLCKMTEDKVRDLIKMRNNGYKFKDLAIHFNITHETAGRVYKKYIHVYAE